MVSLSRPSRLRLSAVMLSAASIFYPPFCPQVILTAASAAQPPVAIEQAVVPAPRPAAVDPSDKAFTARFLRQDQYIPVSEIKEGMEGFGLTVFHGSKVEKFDVRVIGVMRRVLNGRDSILIRISGKNLGSNNVVRGMSGSPIYLDNRLAGALSYGFDFSKEPIVGVTPVADMLDALSFVERKDFREKGAVQKTSRSNKIDVPTVMLARQGFDLKHKADTVGMTPLMAPVTLSGYSTRAQAFLKERMHDLGLSVAAGAGGLDASLKSKFAKESKDTYDLAPFSEGDSPVDKIVPGGSVAVMLSQGDFASAATGTATCVFKDKVVAFGHSFLESGYVNLPMATSYIHDILPSLSVSFKLSSPVSVVGAVFADRPWSIGGELGRTSTMIPLEIKVQDTTRNVQKTFNTRIVEHPSLTSDLVTATVMSAIDATYHSKTPYILRVKTRVDVNGHPSIDRVDRFAGNFSAHGSDALNKLVLKLGGVSDPVSSFAGGVVERIFNNDFERAAIKKVSVDISLEDGRKLSRLEQVTLDKAQVQPGDSVTASCVLRPYNDKTYVRKMTFAVPRDATDGDMVVGIGGGDQVASMRKKLNLNDPPDESLDGIIDRLNRRESSDQLCGLLATNKQSLYLRETTIKDPPLPWLKSFFSDRSTRFPVMLKSEDRQKQAMEDMVDGGHIIAFTVRARDKDQSRQALAQFKVPARDAADGIVMTEQAKKALDTTPASAKDAKDASPAAAVAASADKAQAAPAVVVNAYAQPQVYPHTKAVLMWRQEQEADFRAGDAQGLVIDSLGHLLPGYPRISDIDLPPFDRIIIAATRTSGPFFFASENRVYKKSGNEAILVATLPCTLVTALERDDKTGEIYAATIGRDGAALYRLDATQKGAAAPLRPVWQSPESRPIVTMACVRGRLYLALAGSGLVQRLSGQGLDTVFDTMQARVCALDYWGQGPLFVSCGERGVVLSVDPDSGKIVDQFETNERFATGAAQDKAGNLFVTTCMQGKLLRKDRDGRVETIAISDAFYKLFYDQQSDRVYTGDGEGDVTRAEIDPNTDLCHFIPVCHTEQEAVMGVSRDGDQLVCVTTNMGRLMSFTIAPVGRPTFTSSILAAQKAVRFSRLRLADRYNMVQSDLMQDIEVECRSGNTATPDMTWSAWISPDRDQKNVDFDISGLPNGRYMQYRLRYLKFDRVVSRVDITYQPGNQAPVISNVSVNSNDVLKGSTTITLDAADADLDNMDLELAFSTDGGTSFVPFIGDLRSRAPEKSKDKEKEKEKEKDKPEAKPDSKPEAKPEAKTTAKAESKPETPKKAETYGSTEKFSYALDTKKIAEGDKIMRFRVSDRPTTGVQDMRTAVAFRAVTIDNTAPVIDDLVVVKNAAGRLDIELKGHDALSSLVDATLRWQTRSEVEGFALQAKGAPLNDTRHAVFVGKDLTIPADCKKLTVELYDRGGNMSSKTVNIP